MTNDVKNFEDYVPASESNIPKAFYTIACSVTENKVVPYKLRSIEKNGKLTERIYCHEYADSTDTDIDDSLFIIEHSDGMWKLIDYYKI